MLKAKDLVQRSDRKNLIFVDENNEVGVANNNQEATMLDGSTRRISHLLNTAGTVEQFIESGSTLTEWVWRHTNRTPVVPQFTYKKVLQAAGMLEKDMDVYVVGERLNEKTSEEEIDRWFDRPTDQILDPRNQAFPDDTPTRGNLAKLGLVHPEYQRINLLHPTKNTGEWDAAQAEENAHLLAKRIPRSAKFVLLGRRVQRAFGIITRHRSVAGIRVRKPFGETKYAYGHVCLLLPHPSPINHMWNNSDEINVLAQKTREFLDD